MQMVDKQQAGHCSRINMAGKIQPRDMIVTLEQYRLSHSRAGAHTDLVTPVVTPESWLPKSKCHEPNVVTKRLAAS